MTSLPSDRRRWRLIRCFSLCIAINVPRRDCFIFNVLQKNLPITSHQNRASPAKQVQQDSIAADSQAGGFDGDDGLGLVEILGIAAGEEQAGQLVGNRLG